jgi:hypothetical protein
METMYSMQLVLEPYKYKWNYVSYISYHKPILSITSQQYPQPTDITTNWTECGQFIPHELRFVSWAQQISDVTTN